MTNPAQPIEPLKIKLSDMLHGMQMARSKVPSPPKDAEVWRDGNNDYVHQYGNRRWRYRNGVLIGYIQYRNSGPVLLYGGDY